MKSIKEVKDEYARTLNNGHGGKLKDWDQFSRSAYIDNEDIEEIARLYAQYQTQELQEQNAELVMTLETIASLITSQTSISTVKASLLQILTKHNHLKSNTNE